MKREKFRAKNGSLRNTSKEPTFVILKTLASAPITKERLSPRAKQGGRPAEISLRKRAGCQAEWKALEKSIVARIVREPGMGLQNGLRKIENMSYRWKERNVKIRKD